MPLNLAESALSVVKLGENTLGAIYAGETRVYPNQVQISIDGVQVQTGEPGDAITTPLTYSVTPSNPATKVWTQAQLNAATLTGLPAGWTASISAPVYPDMGIFGNQTGTWSITTSNGLFPSADVNILTSSLTSTIAETGWGTVQVTVNRSGGFGTGTTNLTLKNFVGSSAGTTVLGTDELAVGSYVNTAYNTGGLTNNSGVTCTGAFNNNPYWVKRHSVSCTIPSTGVSNSNISLTSGSAYTGALPYMQPSFGVNAPPYQTPVQGSSLQSSSQVWYINRTSSSIIDPRLRGRLKFSNVTGSSTVLYSILIYPNANSGGTASLPPPPSWLSNSQPLDNFSGRASSGSYTVTMTTNWGLGASQFATASFSNSNWPISGTGQYIR